MGIEYIKKSDVEKDIKNHCKKLEKKVEDIP